MIDILLSIDILIPLVAGIICLCISLKHKKIFRLAGGMLIGASFLLFVSNQMNGDTSRGAIDLPAVVAEINARMPLMIDEDTRVERVDAGADVIIYTLRLINYRAADINTEEFYKTIDELIQSNARSDKNYTMFLDKGISLQFLYYSQDDVVVGTFDVPAETE